MTGTRSVWGRRAVLAVGGGVGFWLANFAISLTPLAAEYRAALNIPYVPMLVEALFGGLILGFAHSLGPVASSITTKNPILASVLLSLVAFTVVTLLIEVPAKIFMPGGDSLRYFLIATPFNAVRILALGAVIGVLYGRGRVLTRT
jgi:hypothetical protein